MAKNVHVIPHMHWDREWYFTTEESRILLVNNMEEILTMLENNENYPYYMLDGQTAILEDYFDVCPENFERVKNLVQKGKLIVGPWYTQTDEMVVGGESIVRNLLYGLKDSRKLGEPMMIGYLPDSFGQSEKLPQILNGFDINRCIFWRGASERHGTTKNNFYWQSESSGEVLVHLLPLGYAIGKYLPQEINALEKRMSKYMPVLEKGAVNDEIALPNGHDQMPIQKNIFEVMESLKEIYPDKNFFLSRFENIFDKVEKENLDTIKGELLDGKYMRVHRSIFSSRADLKSSNTRIENKITNILEPLASIDYSLGNEYHHGLIEAIWKELMKNHAHDSIGCCCSDKVHKAIENRFFLAEDKTDELINFYKRKITDAMSSEECLDKLSVFNLLPYERDTLIESEIITKMKNFKLKDENGVYVPFEIVKTEIVDAGLIDRQIVHYGDYDPFVKYSLEIMDKVPSMGYKTYLIEQSNGNHEPVNLQNSDIAENDFYLISLNKNGTINIKDKENSCEYKNVLLVEDGSDDGDGYDFSPLENDFIVTSKDVTSTSKITSSKNKSTIEISYVLPVPKDLDSRKNKVIDGEISVSFKIEMSKNSKILKINASIDNKAKDHRVRVLVPNIIGSNFSVSDNQFGEIKRNVVDSAMEVWEKEKWDERPDSIYPMLSYVGIDNNEGLAVFTNSVREFEIIGEKFDTIAVTLFRSVGFLGKENLFRRPDRPSGIKMPTPDSQLIGVQSFDFAISKKTKNLGILSKEYLTPIVTYNKMPYNAMKLNSPEKQAPYNYSLLSENSGKFIVSTVKKAENDKGIIIRGYQSEENLAKISFNSHKNLKSELNLDEKEIKKLSTNETLNVERNVIKTYYLD